MQKLDEEPQPNVEPTPIKAQPQLSCRETTPDTGSTSFYAFNFSYFFTTQVLLVLMWELKNAAALDAIVTYWFSILSKKPNFAHCDYSLFVLD
jgi:hypothetical protein